MICSIGRKCLGLGDAAVIAPDLTAGYTAALELAAANELASIKIDNAPVFRTAEPWKYQVDVTAGGIEAFQKYAPFAFVMYSPPARSQREGDGDLNQILPFAFILGTVSKEAGVARIGDTNHLGISKLRDIVVSAIDRWHPGEGFDCDPFYYQSDEVQIDSPTRHALIIYFNTSRITV